MKSRGVYETPGVTILQAAHRALESIALDREVGRLRDSLSVKFAESIYYGFWFSPEFEILRSLIDQTQETVTGDGEYILQRPDHFHTRTAAGRNLESWYNGKVLTIAVHNEKVFGQAPMPENINRTLDALAERYDIALPTGDLFYGPAIKALLSDTVTGGYAGTQDVGGTRCYHLAFKDVGADFELWLPIQGEPLPKRFKVVQKGRTGQPVIDVTFNEWNLAPPITDATFKPKLPADYEGIAMLQRAAAIKNTAAATAPASK